MKNIIAFLLCLGFSFNTFSQIVRVTNDESDDFKIALSDSYLAINKFSSSTMNEELYVYHIYNMGAPALISDQNESYLCDIGSGDYVLFSFLYGGYRLLYVYDAYTYDYYDVDTIGSYDFPKIYNNQLIFDKVSVTNNDTFLIYYNSGEIMNMGLYESLYISDLADGRSIWGGYYSLNFYNGSEVFHLNNYNETPLACQVTNEAAAWVSYNASSGDVQVHYIADTTDVVINPAGYGSADWFDLSGSNLLWMDIRPGKGLYWYNGISNINIWKGDLPSSSNCRVDGSDVVFGGNGYLYHFDLSSHLITTYLLGSNRIPENIQLKSGAVAWTEGSGNNRDVFFAFLNEMEVVSQRYLEVETYQKNNVQLFPNPATEFIQFSGILPAEVQAFEIVDISGRIIKSGILNSSKEINIAELSPGPYFLKAGEQAFKFIKN